MIVLDLGRKEFLETLAVQLKIFREKQKDITNKDYLIVVEHYPIYTCGKSTKKEHIRNVDKSLVVNIERGGSVTFHGFGQIVIYPIIDLNKKNISVKKYVWMLEESIINTLNNFGVKGFRMEGKRGVFTEKGKVGFVGIRVSKGITMHGISLNVDVDLSYFEKIVPCGIYDIPVCNLKQFNSNVNFQQVKQALIENLKSIL